jgi:hypothetical protein
MRRWLPDALQALDLVRLPKLNKAETPFRAGISACRARYDLAKKVISIHGH